MPSASRGGCVSGTDPRSAGSAGVCAARFSSLVSSNYDKGAVLPDRPFLNDPPLWSRWQVALSDRRVLAGIGVSDRPIGQDVGGYCGVDWKGEVGIDERHLLAVRQ